MQKTSLSLRTKKTTKKFYGKWLYKVSLRLEGCALFRTKTLDELEQFLEGPEPTGFPFAVHKKAWHNADYILDLCKAVKNYSKEDYSFRIEGGWIDIYTNEIELYKILSLKFDDILRHRFEPNDATIELLNTNSNYISVDKLPKGRYRYRVYLLPHKLARDRDEKLKYLAWLKKQSPRITCTPSLEKWFLATDWNWDRRYVLVEDEATLLMMKLRNPEVVGRIYNFIISDK